MSDSLQTLLYLAVIGVVVASMWKVFTKAGEPGWASLIPIYNTYVFLKISGRPGWWLILMLIPGVNIFAACAASISCAQRFGKGPWYGLGLAFLGFIFFPMLAWGSATYETSTLSRAA